ncbi:RES domain-containing protein [Ottowia thiooxydans]|uniref:RES domain-containing protein n=1 Tax=Ottowia thiooxydans TaxID=219182 RepID=UPI000411EEF0|nr:RES domain-containing protein [Ottowia thiooxydans]
MPLQPPATDFSDLPLHIKEIAVTSLKRIGRRNTDEPYFGRHAAYRFDDPKKHFGTCYCGQQLDTALAETVLHDEVLLVKDTVTSAGGSTTEVLVPKVYLRRPERPQALW